MRSDKGLGLEYHKENTNYFNAFDDLAWSLSHAKMDIRFIEDHDRRHIDVLHKDAILMVIRYSCIEPKFYIEVLGDTYRVTATKDALFAFICTALGAKQMLDNLYGQYEL